MDDNDQNSGRKIPPPFRRNPSAYPQRALPTDTTRPYGATPSSGAPTPRPETPSRVGTPGPTPATMPTQRPGSTAPAPVEQPRPHPARPVPQQRASAGPVAGMNQGEGDKASARVYEEHLHAFIVSGQVEPAARSAAAAVDGPEGAELRAAEAAGKQPATLSMMDRVKGIARHVVELVGDKLRSRRAPHDKN